jgi:hypothetical protein
MNDIMFLILKKRESVKTLVKKTSSQRSDNFFKIQKTKSKEPNFCPNHGSAFPKLRCYLLDSRLKKYLQLL